MATIRVKRNTYRFTPELDQLISQEAGKLGISKNAYVQVALAKTLTLPGLVSRYGLNGAQTVEGSQEIDQLVTQVMRRQLKRRPGGP